MEVNNLKSYLANIGMTHRAFCEKIDCNEAYLSSIINGGVKAGRRLAKDVFEATDGLIVLPTKPRRKMKGNKHD